MNAKVCPNCKKAVLDNERFCGHCSHELKSMNSSAGGSGQHVDSTTRLESTPAEMHHQQLLRAIEKNTKAILALSILAVGWIPSFLVGFVFLILAYFGSLEGGGAATIVIAGLGIIVIFVGSCVAVYQSYKSLREALNLKV